MSRHEKILLGIFLAIWVWSAVYPKYPQDWLLENVLVVLFLPIVFFGGRYFRLSQVSYTLLTVFMVLHIVGAHYTYAEVPFGYTLQQWLGASRNMYDRMVHFSFGFLFAYPIREIFLRLARVKGFWGYYLPFDVVLAGSAAYELIEWLAAVNVDPAAGIAFLGSQGDIWDAQKDMLAAGVGAVLAMVIIAGINSRYNPDFFRELKASFRIPRDDAPLGEARLQHWLGR